MNKRGVALILGFTVIVVLTILGGAIVSSSISERHFTERFIASTRAFWAAEAGLAKSAAQLPTVEPVSDDNFSGDDNLEYEVPQPTPVSGYTNRWVINSTGRYILNQTTQDKIERTVTAIVEKPEGPDSNIITNAIETTGELEISGNVTINPNEEEYVEEESSLTFESVFGMSKDALKALADRTYTNPPSNQQPVDGITWVDLTGSNKYVISSDWSGSGLLIVNGNGEDVALAISGSWTFEGVIWVIGKLTISGTPVITGAVFAESGADIENRLSGNATLTFETTTKDSVFDLVTQKLGANILSWQEVY